MVFRILSSIPEIGGERGDRIVLLPDRGAYLVRRRRGVIHVKRAVPMRFIAPLIFSLATAPVTPPRFPARSAPPVPVVQVPTSMRQRSL